MGELYVAISEKKYVSLTEARKNKVNIDWPNSNLAKPSFIGKKIFNDRLQYIGQLRSRQSERSKRSKIREESTDADKQFYVG